MLQRREELQSDLEVALQQAKQTKDGFATQSPAASGTDASAMHAIQWGEKGNLSASSRLERRQRGHQERSQGGSPSTADSN